MLAGGSERAELARRPGGAHAGHVCGDVGRVHAAREALLRHRLVAQGAPARAPPCLKPPCLQPRRLRPARRAPGRCARPAARPPTRRPRALDGARATDDAEAARRLFLVRAMAGRPGRAAGQPSGQARRRAAQATVQAALAASLMDAVRAAYPGPPTPEAARYGRFAEDALVTAVFCIVICSAVGTLLIRWFAPALLDQARARVGPGALACGCVAPVLWAGCPPRL